MCLLRVYLRINGDKRRLIAEEVALISREDDKLRLRDVNFKETVLSGVDIAMIDALNSILLIERKG